ncbi:MAG: hypothetical protein M3R07_07715 [Gemmatimonadota bacterium]|nr:hypothetical protein [Gemmatimonadota bacterium]
MITNFEFEDAGRRFTCTVETPSHAGMQPWWWFSVATEGGTTRYAPFEAKPNDTKKSVQSRIVAYYEEVLAIKARPVHPRPQWQRPAAQPPAAPATTEPAPPQA